MQILFEDDDMIVCYKEAGLPVQTANIRQKDLTDILRTHLMQQETAAGCPQEPYLGIIHRIDQPVRGLTVFARNAKAAANLSSQINSGKMKKTYVALVCPESERVRTTFEKPGKLTDYLVKEVRTNMSKAVSEKTPGAKISQLEYCSFHAPLESVFPEIKEYLHTADNQTTADIMALEINLLTGRHHQIRVQLSHAGAPIIGDRKYGNSPQYPVSFPCLCAYRLELYHPKTGERLHFTTPNCFCN